MGKMVPALMTVFLLEIALIYFGGTSYTQTALYTFLSNPTGYTSSAFYLVLVGILTASAAAVIVAGSFYQVNQWALFAGAGVAVITFVANISHVWGFVNGQLVGMFSNSEMGGFIATLITAPLFLFYLVAVVEWSRQN